MPDIKIHVHTQGGDSHPIEAPPDIGTEDFIRELISGLNLPMRDAENNPISWTIDDKDVGRTLDPTRSLDANGVREGHHLYLRRQVTAGNGPRRL